MHSRLAAFNRTLGEVCAEYARCAYDGGAAFRTKFGGADVSIRDFFHPSKSGQQKLADVAWRMTLREPAAGR